MKKIILPIAILTISLFACKKESPKPTVTVTPTVTDTTKTGVDTTNTVVNPGVPVDSTLGGKLRNVYDIDGNVYIVRKIANQEWFTENLKTTRLNDGTPILQKEFKIYKDLIYATKDELEKPNFTYYNNDETTKNLRGDISQQNNARIGGLLYNVSAAKSNICPTGFKVPTQVEFDTLISNGYYGTDAMHLSFIEYKSPLGNVTPWFTYDPKTEKNEAGLTAIRFNQSIDKVIISLTPNTVSAIRCMRWIE